MSKAAPRARDRDTSAAEGAPRWPAIYAQLTESERQAPLGGEDLERLAMAAFLTGRDAESYDVLARAHQAWLASGDGPRAARCAFWIGFRLIAGGDRARGAGWLARAQRILDEGQHDCVERGYMLVPIAFQHVQAGQMAAAHESFTDADRIGERFGDRDLVSLARHGRGRTLIALGEIARGVSLLDEVMVGVTAGEVSTIIAGTIYCSVISACFEMFDMRRAQEWTSALTRWCESQTDIVPYRGECLVHRAEILRLHGVWPDAIAEAEQACERLAQVPGHRAAGAAFYQLAELHRLRGDLAKAEEAYRRASECGRTPHPGLALLRLAQGRVDLAKAAMDRLLGESQDRRLRSMMLSAGVDILLASQDVAAARRAADELASIASTLDTPFLRAVSAQATGAVLLAEGDAKAALASLRHAWTIWHDLEAPYETARVHVLIGLACRELGDVDSGQLEIDAACRVFRQLGAVSDMTRLQALMGVAAPKDACGLTAREIEVLRLIASGKTNRAIADTLAISEKTVARHVSNIFTKLDVPSRAAATAYAFQHNLV